MAACMAVGGPCRDPADEDDVGVPGAGRSEDVAERAWAWFSSTGICVTMSRWYRRVSMVMTLRVSRSILADGVVEGGGLVEPVGPQTSRSPASWMTSLRPPGHVGGRPEVGEVLGASCWSRTEDEFLAVHAGVNDA